MELVCRNWFLKTTKLTAFLLISLETEISGLQRTHVMVILNASVFEFQNGDTAMRLISRA